MMFFNRNVTKLGQIGVKKARLDSRQARQGFTLIELLVVIAIIGILASVVLASLNQARRKSRDARRLADVKQLQVAMELYFDANTSIYPTTIGLLTNGCAGGPCIQSIVNDPLNTAYTYVRLSGSDYTLATLLEDSSNAALTNKYTGSSGLDCSAARVYCAKP